MKTINIKKQLKKEFNAKVPSDFENLFNECKKVCSDAEADDDDKQIKESNKKTILLSGLRYRSVVAAVLAITIFVTGIVTVLLNKNNNNIVNPPPIIDAQGGYFLIDINPSLELKYDKDGKIIEAKGLNKDGEILLTNLNIVGTTYSMASELIFNACIELGYFSADRKNNAVLVSAISENGTKDHDMTSAMKEEMSDYFVEKKIYGTVITGVHNSELDEEADKYGINGQKLALIKQYEILGGHIDDSQYASLSIRELYDLISKQKKKNDQEIIDKLTESVKETKIDLMEDVREHIEDLIDELSSSIEDLLDDSKSEEIKEQYETQLQYLEDTLEQVEDIEDEKEFLTAVDKLLAYVLMMETEESNENLQSALKAAYDSIYSLRNSFNSMMEELEKQAASAKENYEDRKNKYDQSPMFGEADKDIIEKWQKEQEKKLESDWYAIKGQWDLDRESDLDD